MILVVGLLIMKRCKMNKNNIKDIKSSIKELRESIVDILENKAMVNYYVKSEIIKMGVKPPSINVVPPVTYSQNGEDIIAISILTSLLDIPIDQINYVEIGANHPINMSNTYKFYKLGAEGILIEPNPELCKEIEKVRPRDICLNTAITEENDLTYYVTNYPELNTLSIDYIKKWNATDDPRKIEIIQKIKVKKSSINDILNKYFEDKDLHYLSIDVEGEDEKILRSINYERFSPFLICIEPSDYFFEGRSESIDKFMDTQNYKKIAQNHANRFYVKRELLECKTRK